MQGFEAVREEPTAGKKPVKYWRLTEEAVTNSIQSTTRYRKQTNYKKSVRRIRLHHSVSGQELRGEATRFTARFRSLGHSIHGLSPGEYQRNESVGTSNDNFTSTAFSLAVLTPMPAHLPAAPRCTPPQQPRSPLQDSFGRAKP